MISKWKSDSNIFSNTVCKWICNNKQGFSAW